MKRLVLACLGVATAALLAGCSKEGCLGGDAKCVVPPPCPKVKLTCDDAAGAKLAVATIASAAERPGGWDGLGAKGDVKLSNAATTVTIAGLGTQNLLDPNGGSILDLLPAGTDTDSVNQILQVVGILPGDAVHYTSLEIIDERPARVAVQVKGALDGRPGVLVATRYELTPCDQGVRVRTEVVNTTTDREMWSLVDGYYWSGREAIPFTAGAGQGFTHPSFSLLSINDAYQTFAYLAASGHSTDEHVSGIAAVSCTEPTMEGFQSDQVSAAGLKRTIVPPRGGLVFERFIAVGHSKGVGAAVDVAQQVRAQVLGTKLATVKGVVERPAAKHLDSERETSVLISEGSLTDDAAKRVPVTQVVPNTAGAFTATLVAGKTYVVEVHSFGRKQVEKEFTNVAGDGFDLGTFTLPSTATANFIVTDQDSATPIDAEIFVIPADDTVAAAVTGSFHGRFTTCSPWLGPPPGASPACNRVLVRKGVAQAEVPVGRFHVYAFHGPFWSLGHEVRDFAAGTSSMSFALKDLQLAPSDAVSADLHVHGAPSFDSSIPDYDRVLSFSASKLDVIIATDHDVVGDYTQMMKTLGFDGTMSAVNGVETTGHIPFMTIPNYGFPLVIGHYNFWPIKFDPSLPRNGGPYDELVEPGMLFERTKPLFSGTPLIELNHPWADPEFGRDLGFPRALSLDMTKDLPAQPDATSSGMYFRTPQGASFANDAHHAQEVMNGSANAQYLQYRSFWFYVLNQGRLKTGTANSDSHSLTDNTVGMPRNLVYAATKGGPSFDVNAFNDTVQKGRVLGTNGPIIVATLEDSTGTARPFSLTPFSPRADGKLKVKVTSAPWIPVEQVRFVVNGQVALTSPAKPAPADPFSTSGDLTRFEGEVALSELLSGVTGDAWIVVEAGRKLPVVGDLGGGLANAKDGMPDTSDNNGDGVVDAADVKAGSKVGPLADLPAPKEGETGFEYFNVTGGSPTAFTNPFVLDRDGDGKFTAPGVKGGR